MCSTIWLLKWGAVCARCSVPVFLGPDAPPVARIQLLYIRKIVVKVEPGASLAKVREQLLYLRQSLMAHPDYRSAQIYYDVDPM